MFTTIIQRTVSYWAENGIIEDFDRDIYEYGFDLILSTIVNIVVVVISAVFVKRLPESITLLAVIIPLQSCGGGYHAKTHLRCFLIMYIGWWGIIWMIPYVNLISAIIIAGVSLIVIFAFAPVRHENVPISEKQFLKMKVLVRWFSIGASIVGVFLLWLVGADNNIGISVIMGMGVVAVSMIVAKVMN